MKAILKHNELTKILGNAIQEMDELTNEILIEVNQSDNPLQTFDSLDHSFVKRFIFSEINKTY